MATEGDFTTLPASVFGRIVKSIDIETLAACCCSCKEWYDYLNANDTIWKKACKRFGLKQAKDTNPRDWGTWRDYALLIVKRLKQMRNSECFISSSSFSIDMRGHGEVQAIYYYKNRLAVATAERIEMWCTISNSLIFDIVDLPYQHALRNLSLKFDELHILVGGFWNCIRRFGVYSRRQEAVYLTGTQRLLSYDFDSRCDIVVGYYDCNIIYIWRLSSGKSVKNIPLAPVPPCQKVKIIFIRSPTTDERGLLYLLFLHLEGLFVWSITFGGDTSEDGTEYICIDNVKRLDFDHPLWFRSMWNISIINSLLNHGSFVYYSQPSASESCVINEFDLNTGEISRKIETNEIIRSLLAVGEKYIVFHTVGKEGIGEQILVIEKTSSKLVTTYQVPEGVVTPYKGETFKIVFCDGNWLDGLDLTNDRGVVFAYVWRNKEVHFVEWIKRTGCAA